MKVITYVVRTRRLGCDSDEFKEFIKLNNRIFGEQAVVDVEAFEKMIVLAEHLEEDLPEVKAFFVALKEMGVDPSISSHTAAPTVDHPSITEEVYKVTQLERCSDEFKEFQTLNKRFFGANSATDETDYERMLDLAEHFRKQPEVKLLLAGLERNRTDPSRNYAERLERETPTQLDGHVERLKRERERRSAADQNKCCAVS